MQVAFAALASVLLLACEPGFSVKFTNTSRESVEVFADEYSMGKVESGETRTFTRGITGATLRFRARSGEKLLGEIKPSDQQRHEAYMNGKTYELSWDGTTMAQAKQAADRNR